ncbi:hypothetical protein K2X89_05225 [Myxococcota bacterium]|nr:hypothetical protein [Myxococcota bacterium]
MIRDRRRAHRRIHQALWPTLALVFAALLTDRRPIDSREDWPTLLAHSARPLGGDETPASATSHALWSSRDAFGGWPARMALFADGSVEIQPLRPLDRPELLVYWVSEAQPGDRLPDSAHLLGRLAGPLAQRFTLPARALTRIGTASSTASPEPSTASGALVVYSLGHQEIVATARLAPAEARP